MLQVGDTRVAYCRLLCVGGYCCVECDVVRRLFMLLNLSEVHTRGVVVSRGRGTNPMGSSYVPPVRKMSPHTTRICLPGYSLQRASCPSL